MDYKLPNHPSSLVSDPLSILDSEESKVPYWDFLEALLRPILSSLGDPTQNDESTKDILNTQELETQKETKSETAFFDALDVIGYSLSLSVNDTNSTSRTRDFSLLRSYLHPPRLLTSKLLQAIIKFALKLPTLFPSGLLPILGNITNQPNKTQPPPVSYAVSLSSPQITCILCHMVLGTLLSPQWPDASWNPNLTQTWFADDGKGDREIKRAYIQVLLKYLESNLLYGDDLETERSVTYQLVEYQDVQSMDGEDGSDDNELLFVSLSSDKSGIRNKRLVSLTVILLDEEDDDCESCFGIDGKEDNHAENGNFLTEVIQFVSANREIGFGPAATQEERLFGAVPSLLPIVYFTPPLSPTQALLVSGNGTTVCARFKGHLRTAQLDTVYTKIERDDAAKHRKGRLFLFMDALEMDGDLHGRDRELHLVKRELKKLIAGFAALTKPKTTKPKPKPKTRKGQRQRQTERNENENGDVEDADEDEDGNGNGNGNGNGDDSERKKARERRGRAQVGTWTRVVVPPWGCGTFGGDLTVKLLLIWLAASIVFNQPILSKGDPDIGAAGDLEGGNEKEDDEQNHIELRFPLRRDLWNRLDPQWRNSLGRIRGFTLQGAEHHSGTSSHDTLPVYWGVGQLWDDVSGGVCLGERKNQSKHQE